MKKQISKTLILVSTIISMVGTVQAQTGVADNLTSIHQKIANSDVPDNMLSLLTALRAQGYSTDLDVDDVSPYQNGSEDNFECSEASLNSEAGCELRMGAMMARVSNVVLPENKDLVVNPLSCERVRVRNERQDINLYGPTRIDGGGMTVISNESMDCSVTIKFQDR